MKNIAKASWTLLLLVLATPSFGQISSTISTSRTLINHDPLPVGGVVHHAAITPLGANLAFSVNVPQWTMTFPSDFKDHQITGTLTNLTDSLIYLNFHRHQFLPPNWTTSVCFGSLCLSSDADSSRNAKSFPFTAHQSQALIVHFTDNNPDTTPVNTTVSIVLIVQQEFVSSSDTIILHLTQVTDTTLDAGADVVPHSTSLSGPPSILSIYPNPSIAAQPMTAQIYSPTSGTAIVTIYDVSGQALRQVKLTQPLQPGTNVLRFDPSGLSSGAYLLGVDIQGGAHLSRPFQVTK